MVARNRARYVAPIVLAATITATYVIVHDQLTTTHASTRSHLIHRSSRPRGKFAKATFYVVQSGDTLSTISVRAGVSVPTLEALNPSVNPNALQTGQRLRLRR
jgi:spore germination protein YaaH